MNALSIATKKLGLTVDFENSKVMVFRKRGFLGAREKQFWDDQELEVVNTYKYLGLFIFYFFY